MKLILGVVDVAYSEKGSTATTGDVAEILESRYHIMETFLEIKSDKIGGWLADDMAAFINAMASGAPMNRVPTLDAEQRIDSAFRRFLDDGEMEQVLPMTQQITAAQMGVNSRKKAGYNKDREARPAFIDTGLYQRSFRSEITP